MENVQFQDEVDDGPGARKQTKFEETVHRTGPPSSQEVVARQRFRRRRRRRRSRPRLLRRCGTVRKFRSGSEAQCKSLRQNRPNRPRESTGRRASRVPPSFFITGAMCVSRGRRSPLFRAGSARIVLRGGRLDVAGSTGNAAVAGGEEIFVSPGSAGLWILADDRFPAPVVGGRRTQTGEEKIIWRLKLSDDFTGEGLLDHAVKWVRGDDRIGSGRWRTPVVRARSREGPVSSSGSNLAYPKLVRCRFWCTRANVATLPGMD